MPTRTIPHRRLSITVLRGAVAVLILKVTISVVVRFVDYFPANFDNDFLIGRDGYFFGAYSFAFYAHIVGGPCTLVLGIVLLSDQFRLRFSTWHRRLGRVQVGLVAVTAISGTAMAFRARTGPLAGLGFGMLGIATMITVLFGWRTAVGRRFKSHRHWMQRCFVLLCSAVVLRLLGGLTIIAGIRGNRPYQTAAWISWLLPLFVLESSRRIRRRA